MEKEFFKPLIGWENKYHIGSYGTIKSIGRNIGNHSGYFKPENIRKVLPDKDGYFEINLPLNNRHTKGFHISVIIFQTQLTDINKEEQRFQLKIFLK